MTLGNHRVVRLRPMFLVPWWLFLWMSGRRYSLRRIIGNTLVAAIAAFAAATAWFWAAKNAQRPYLLALPYVEIAAALAAAYTSLEPFLRVLFETLRTRRVNTAAIKLTGWGFTAWWAFITAGTLFWQSHRFPFLHAWLIYLHSTDYYFADAKFLVATTLAILPFVVLVRQGLIAIDGTPIGGSDGVPPLPQRPSRPVFGNGMPGHRQIPESMRSQASRPPQIEPPPRSVPPPRPARIISVDTSPSPNDRS